MALIRGIHIYNERLNNELQGIFNPTMKLVQATCGLIPSRPGVANSTTLSGGLFEG